MYDWEDFWFKVAGSVLGLLGIILLVVLLGLLFDEVQGARARESYFACEVRNLQPVRKRFSTEVVCRPRILGSDTLNLKQVQ